MHPLLTLFLVMYPLALPVTAVIAAVLLTYGLAPAKES